MPEKLLRTKLFVPPLRPNLVPRPNLIERLNQGLHLGHRLTLISAAAGFGKTTLVCEWASSLRMDAANEEQIICKTAWLSLDNGDNDVGRFLTYLATAINQVEGIETTTGNEALGMLQSPQSPPVNRVLTSLINDISAIPDRIVLVLDDYHIIESSAVDDALTFFLENLPPQMHLVIATRDDPNLPLARQRARGLLTELRVSDLRFTSAEAAQFLNKVMGLDLSTGDVAALESRTEGWVAGLQLAAISMQGRENIPGLVASFTGSHRFVLDFLIEEVLEQQPEYLQAFLLQTSILSRLSGSLCNALTGQQNGRTALETLERANLFIIPLDDARHWYRYHHLFADLLRHRLDQEYPDQISELHQRASTWYERNHLPSDSIHHALAAEDFERAADLAELAWPSMSGSFQSIEWLGWVKSLPDALVRVRPVLAVCYAWAFLNSGNLEDAEERLIYAERWLEPSADMNERLLDPMSKMVVIDEEQFRSLPISLAVARAYHAQAAGDGSGTVKHARRALDLMPEGDSPWRGDATALLALAQWTSGKLEDAHSTLSEGLARMKPFDVIIGTFVLVDMKIALGQLRQAERTCEHALQLAFEHGEPMPLGTEDVYTAISALRRERGDLEGAARDLLTGKKLGEQVELPDWQYRWCIAQALLEETRGNLDGALDFFNESERLYVRTPLPVLRPIAAMKTRIWIAQGRLDNALSWAREQKLSANDELTYLHEFEHITFARVLIAQFKSDLDEVPTHEAVSLLERLLQAAVQGGRIGSVIEILVLQALAQEAQDNIAPALVSLERSLALAEPEGYLRLFVNEGPPMLRLLTEAAAHEIMPDYVGKLLAALKTEERKGEQYAVSSPAQPLIEPLSQRELEVLGLIALGLSNREIGERLFLALNTVKGHNRNIFGKLGVQRRTEAVARARELGLI